MHLKEKDSIN